MDRATFRALKCEIAAHATFDQLADLNAQAARLLDARNSHKCPHCGGEKIVRCGRDRAGRQRFRCLKVDETHGCGRTFSALGGSASPQKRKPER